MGYLKGRSALMIFDKYPEYRKKWNREFWATGYYVTTVGETTEEQEDADKEADTMK